MNIKKIVDKVLNCLPGVPKSVEVKVGEDYFKCINMSPRHVIEAYRIWESARYGTNVEGNNLCEILVNDIDRDKKITGATNAKNN